MQRHCGYRAAVWNDEKVLVRDSGGTTVWMYLMPLNYTLKMAKMVILCSVYFSIILKSVHYIMQA